MKIIKINTALKKLRKVNEEILYQSCFEEKQFTTGLIVFRPKKNPDSKQINHR